MFYSPFSLTNICNVRFSRGVKYQVWKSPAKKLRDRETLYEIVIHFGNKIGLSTQYSDTVEMWRDRMVRFAFYGCLQA